MIVYGIIFFLLIIACFLCLYRIGIGPTAPDRSVAMDILGIVIVCFCAIFGLYTGKEFFLDLAIAWALLSFIGSIALAKFLEGKKYDD